MTDWIEHTTDTCPVDPETVVEVRHGKHHRVSSGKALYMPWGRYSDRLPGGGFGTPALEITHYRIITPTKPPEPDMIKTAQERAAAMVAATKPEPDLITLRLECLKLAVGMLDRLTFREGSTVADAADDLLHYVLNGSVDKA
jgi:hypothetical protein